MFLIKDKLNQIDKKKLSKDQTIEEAGLCHGSRYPQ